MTHAFDTHFAVLYIVLHFIFNSFTGMGSYPEPTFLSSFLCLVLFPQFSGTPPNLYGFKKAVQRSKNQMFHVVWLCTSIVSCILIVCLP